MCRQASNLMAPFSFPASGAGIAGIDGPRQYCGVLEVGRLSLEQGWLLPHEEGPASLRDYSPVATLPLPAPSHRAPPRPAEGERPRAGAAGEGGAGAAASRAGVATGARARLAGPSRLTSAGPTRSACLCMSAMRAPGARQTHRDAQGRTWSVALVSTARAAAEDAKFWRKLTPEQRVMAVHGCLESALKARGMARVPRLRRVARVVER